MVAELCALQILQVGSPSTISSMLSFLFFHFLMKQMGQIASPVILMPNFQGRQILARIPPHSHTHPNYTFFQRQKCCCVCLLLGPLASACVCSLDFSPLAASCLEILFKPIPGRHRVFPSTRFFPRSFKAQILGVCRCFPLEPPQATSSPVTLTRLPVLVVHLLVSLLVSFVSWARGRKIPT